MLDQVGIIHMGGRIYGPTLGRFMSADPVVKGLDNTESYNRYSYVLNSPMSYTDPSGYSWLSDAWGDITDFFEEHVIEVAVAIVSPQVSIFGAMAAGYGGRELARLAAKNKYGGEVLGLVGTAVCSFATGGAGTAGCATKFQGVTSMAIAHENGASVGQSLLAGMSSAALAAANIGIAGKIGETGANFAVSGALHGMRGGIIAGLAGGDARSGLIGGSTEGVFGGWIRGWTDDDPTAGTVLAGFISGSVSQATGGKFAVGAATGAMGYLFNEMREEANEAVSIVEEGDSVSIRLRMKFIGDGATGEVIERFIGGIEKYWTGEFGSKNVTTNVHIVDLGEHFEIMVPSGDGRAYMNGIGGLTGNWPAERPAWTAAHEMGHGMGLSDQYNYTTGAPNPGYRNNIMGARDKVPSESDILEIIRINQ